MQAAFNATMLPHLARLAEKTGSEAQKVKTAELANATAHETLAGDRLKLDEAMQAVKLRETELAREQDVSKSRYEKVVEDSKPVLKESVADAQQELAFLKTATAAAYANKTRRCTKVHEDAALGEWCETPASYMPGPFLMSAPRQPAACAVHMFAGCVIASHGMLH